MDHRFLTDQERLEHWYQQAAEADCLDALRAASLETVRTQGTKTSPALNVCRFRKQIFQISSENEDCESVAGSEHEILGGVRRQS
jgi:hypothetical protein